MSSHRKTDPAERLHFGNPEPRAFGISDHSVDDKYPGGSLSPPRLVGIPADLISSSCQSRTKSGNSLRVAISASGVSGIRSGSCPNRLHHKTRNPNALAE